jgi:hypothetical protein
MKRFLLTILLVVSLPVMAAGPDAVAQKEVEHLMNYLASSGCQFNRNGTWYDAPRASDHLRQKYDYLLRKNLVATAEDFIERAASESSVSGKPYLVKCKGHDEVQSGAWFRAELARFRNTP